MLFTGSRWDGHALDWLAKRRATVVTVGSKRPSLTLAIEYPGSEDPDVTRYTEILVPELLAARWWLGA
jgi:glutamine---fructose-6-phosphate transaminase (isomerizing)